MDVFASASATQDLALDVAGVVIIGGLILGAAAAFVWIIRYWIAFDRRVGSLKAIVKRIDRNDLVGTRGRVRKQADDVDPKVLGPLWHEFDETLVATDDGTRLFNTAEAEYFFNRDTIAAEYSDNRLLAAAPGLLAAFGVFGTFVSLYIGLQGLNAGSADDLAAGVQHLMSAAGLAFLKSVWGVGLSLVVTFTEKIFERHIARSLTPLQNQVDRIYRRTTPEKSLVDVADYTRASMHALQELHERIGNRLQEAVQSISSDLESALRGAIDSAMTPAMQQLVDTASKQSTDVFEELVEKFSSSFTSIGEQQANMLNDSSERLNGAIDRVSSEFETMVAESRGHAQSVAERQAEIIVALDSTLQSLTTASGDLTSAATSLSDVSGHVEEAGAALGRGLTQTSATLMALYERALAQAQEIERMGEQTEGIGADLVGAASSLVAATGEFGAHLTSFTDAQTVFQTGMRGDVESIGAALHAHVSALEEQVGRWLSDYSADIEKQIADRMGVWDSHSRDYAANMLSTARSLRELLDDIQTRADVEEALTPAIAAAVSNEPELQPTS